MNIREGHFYKFMWPVFHLVILNTSMLFALELWNWQGFNLKVHADVWLVFNLLWFISAQILDVQELNKLKHGWLLGVFSSLLLYYALLLVYVALFMGVANYFGFTFFHIVLFACSYVCFRVFFNSLGGWLKRKFSAVRSISVLGLSNANMGLDVSVEVAQSTIVREEHLSDLLVDQYGPVSIQEHILSEIWTASDRGVTDIYLPLRSAENAGLVNLLDEADKYCVRLKLVPDLSPAMGVANSHLDTIEGLPVIDYVSSSLDDIGNRVLKRLMDIVISSLAIVFVCSWLVPIVGLLIKLSSRGPIFFRQLRNGRDNGEFWCYKFRSMRAYENQASRDENRITPIGRFLRRTNLDEVPQFFNVLIGDMSLVGPRPYMLKHTEEYRELIGRYMVRHYLKPGITGWAQANGYRGETSDLTQMEKRVEHDIWYFENWSPLLDLKIFFMTFWSLFRREGKSF